MNKSFLTHCFSKILLQIKKGLSKKGSHRLLKLVVIGVLSIQLFVPIYPVIAGTTQSTMATTEKTQAESSTETSQTTASSEPEETSESATDSSIVTSTTDSIQATTASEVESSGTSESNEDAINLAQLQTDLLNRIAAFGDVTGTTVTVDNQTITIDLSTTLSEQADEIKKAITPLIPEGYSAKIMAKSAATTVGFWTKGADVDSAHNTGTYGDAGLEKYVYTAEPFQDTVTNTTVDTVAKTEVLKKGIFGTVKWYISTDGVLHLGSGTTGVVNWSAFPNNTTSSPTDSLSPWYQYKNEFTFTSISVDGAITLNAASIYLFAQLDNITKISGADKLNFAAVTDVTGMFQNTSSLTEMSDTGGWKLTAAKSASSMFANSGIKILDATNWGLGLVTSFASMFNGAKNLTTIVGTNNWNTESVGNMIYMFIGATSLQSLEVSDWNTSKVSKMQEMFSGATSLKTLDVSKWDTSKVITLQSMFNNATNLQMLDVSNWDTSSLVNMQEMVRGASALTEFDVSKWKTPVLTSMNASFRGAASITKLDFSNMDTSKVTTMANALTDMKALRQITFGSKFTTSSLTAPVDKNLVLPNATATSELKWQNVGTGSISAPAGSERIYRYSTSGVPDTYVLTATDYIIDVELKDQTGTELKVPHVKVALYKAGDSTALATAETDSNGTAKFAPQPAGAYIVKQITELASYTKSDDKSFTLSSDTTTITLINSFKPTLPLTGSTDRLWLGMLASLMIIIGGSAIVIYEKW
ncbi:BspA family leucine-rich repeat surface protein [Enterococcus massiliensis]|uniref:BspA family leucine-rich repeat surface protein n=1 Tax=Enterococcus massiliensis TaxID=1640685 RepID=UPI00065E4EB1|nr:BspA family leucine-rich repeat surface protein [Enterococcus massiliensis]